MRTTISIAVLAATLAGCQGDSGSGSDADADSGGEASTGGDVTSSATTESDADGTSDSGDTTDGDSSTSSGSTSSAEETGNLEPIEILNIQSAASAMNGDSLTITDYTVPADGILVVHGGATGPTVQSVTFDGEALEAVASHEEPDYWFAISADMYWMPVTAGQAGDIHWQYQPGNWTTSRRGMIAATLSGVDQVHVLTTVSDGLPTNQGRTGPSLAEDEITTTQEAIILSAFTSNGPGPSDLTGPGHTLDAFPTVPIEDFHSTRVYGGHVLVGPDTVTLGYENNETNGWFDYILFLAAFSRG